MASGKASYASTALRERDQQLHGKHQGQLDDLQRRHAYVERNMNAKLFDATNRGHKLAELLGYSGLDEALMDIGSAGLGPSLRDSVQRVQAAKARLELEQIDNKILQAKLEKKDREYKDLQVQNKTLETAHRRLSNEHKDLTEKYDKLADVRQRAGERYKADYLAWKAFYFWLVSDGPDSEHPAVSEKEKARIAKWKPGVLQKRQDIINGRINVSFLGGYSEDTPSVRRAPPFGSIEMPECDKENEGTPMPPRKRPRTTPAPSSPTPLPSSTLLKSVTNFNSPSKSSSRLSASTGTLVSTRPILSSKYSPARIAPPIDGNANSPHLSPARDPNTSETEEDSQPILFARNRSTEITPSKPPESPTRASSSKLEALASLPLRSIATKLSPERSKLRHSLAERMQIDDDASNAHRRSSMHERTSKFVSDVTSSTGKGKERQVQNNYQTPVQDKIIRPNDYSAFKGRGRYGNTVKATEPTKYAIDPKNNGGLNYQYDEVVRNREERRKMHGGDCECCREYYEGVGPLPSRLQAPLWRSPTSSPQKDRQKRRVAEIESHKKAISRHRHTWARAPTPPGYWDIGFPDTQEATEINRKAAEMHKRKQEEIEREAARGGRYRRRS
ncbi:hypothetical protein BDN70DRAFT_875891 [Pholiota conissans]|uniref:DNA endonuclease activator Ctp1 C-terminal domain-containing protein n=1 Tax=Pholiota conissans TaxID=109636 RepID=A0A9P5Z7S7_9AGAR|nr:hypothetical protein BDN70DRAFT_875891 [Pholiota conissans]